MIHEPFSVLHKKDLKKEHNISWSQQRDLEAEDSDPFEIWLKQQSNT